jgi:hypothetical protein
VQKASIPELLVIRLMRSVSYLQICDEIRPSIYASNDCTSFITQKGIAGGHKHFGDLLWPVAAKLVELKRTHGIHMFPAPEQIGPFEYAYGGPIFEHFAINQEQEEAFNDYMSARRSPETPQWFEVYPAVRELAIDLRNSPGDLLVVDVGGGKGHEMVKFRQRHPDLPGRLVVQDRKSVIRDAGEQGTEGVEFVTHDFFSKQPLKGQSAAPPA